jgi:hypothetical protein
MGSDWSRRIRGVGEAAVREARPGRYFRCVCNGTDSSVWNMVWQRILELGRFVDECAKARRTGRVYGYRTEARCSANDALSLSVSLVEYPGTGLQSMNRHSNIRSRRHELQQQLYLAR